jgi:3-phenylpropionate/trans-cinnamate dioxygenase ferredoxin reductase subunit
MDTPNRIVVVGAGLAGAKTVEHLRALGFTGSLTLVGSEAEVPYERPPLSKDYLAGAAEVDDFQVHPLQWYRDNDIDLRSNTEATAIHTKARTVLLSSGEELHYDALVLATGSSPRRATLAGAEGTGVLYLRNRQDSDKIREAITAGKTLTIIGGGWIGLEVAAAARNAGADVTVLERSHLPLANTVGNRAAEVLADLHREHGVDLRTNTEAARIILEDNAVAGVELKDGTELSSDCVLMSIGAVPNTHLAKEAGLSIEAGGVAVDSALRSSDPAIFAVGDIAAQDHPVLGSRVRVEHWASALNQPEAVAHTILGKSTDYEQLPYFFTDQYDLGMEYLGAAPVGAETDVVIRGDLGSREFIVFYLDTDGAIAAAMAVNMWDVIDAVQPLIIEKTRVEPSRLADPRISLSDIC